MADTVAPEFARFIAAQRSARRLPAAPRASSEGQVLSGVPITAKQAEPLLRVAARRASGMFRPSKRTEVVWVDGDSEVAIGIDGLTAKVATGLLQIGIPVRSDQTGEGMVEVTFAIGSASAPAGLFAATARKPTGPELIVASWGDALVAFAWQCLLGLVTGIAGATGKDQRGNLLVPVELSANARGLEIVPMARHRFAGGNTLVAASKPVGNK